MAVTVSPTEARQARWFQKRDRFARDVSRILSRTHSLSWNRRHNRTAGYQVIRDNEGVKVTWVPADGHTMDDETLEQTRIEKMSQIDPNVLGKYAPEIHPSYLIIRIKE